MKEVEWCDGSCDSTVHPHLSRRRLILNGRPLYPNDTDLVLFNGSMMTKETHADANTLHFRRAFRFRAVIKRCLHFQMLSLGFQFGMGSTRGQFFKRVTAHYLSNPSQISIAINSGSALRLQSSASFRVGRAALSRQLASVIN